jgi:hypothetical protein
VKQYLPQALLYLISEYNMPLVLESLALVHSPARAVFNRYGYVKIGAKEGSMVRLNKQQKLTALIAVVLILVLGTLVFSARRSREAAIATPTATPTPSPGQPGNPGDVAKEAQSTVPPTAKPTTPTPAPASIGISDFTVTPQGDGTVHVANIITGASSGTCSIELSHSGSSTITQVGSIITSGTYYFCSFGAIAGVTDTGSWTAKLTATSGSLSGSATTSFTK